MLTLAASGTVLALLKSQAGNVIGGVVTLYMVATAWRAGRQRIARIGLADRLSFVCALAIGSACVAVGWRVAHGTLRDGNPAGMDFFFGFTVLVAAAGDLRVLLRGGIAGTPRIARHLWRMCFGLFIASGSFFMGRQGSFSARWCSDQES